MYDMIHRFGFGEVDGQRFSRRIAGFAADRDELGPGRKSDDLVRLRPQRDAAAARSSVRRDRATTAACARRHSSRARGIPTTPSSIRKSPQNIGECSKRWSRPEGTGVPKAAVANYLRRRQDRHGAHGACGRRLQNKYAISLFVGMVPASEAAAGRRRRDPRSAGRVLRRRSSRRRCSSKVMDGALRLLDVPPDNVQHWYTGRLRRARRSTRKLRRPMTRATMSNRRRKCRDDARDESRRAACRCRRRRSTQARSSVRGLALDSRDVRDGDAFVALARRAATRHHVCPDRRWRVVLRWFSRAGPKKPRTAPPFLSWRPRPTILSRDRVRCRRQTRQCGNRRFDAAPPSDRRLRAKLGSIAARFFGAPSRALKMIGVTGTNGKTSIVNCSRRRCSLPAQRRRRSARSARASSATIVEGARTTPDVIAVQGLLAEFRDAGASHVAMEVSSHALDQGRVNAVAFDRRGVHQPHARSSRLSRHDGSVRRGQGKSCSHGRTCARRSSMSTTRSARAASRDGLRVDVAAYGVDRDGAENAATCAPKMCASDAASFSI